MNIELTDTMVDSIVITELKWAYEYTYIETEEEGNTDMALRIALREVLCYFMPRHDANSYLKAVENKYYQPPRNT
jgi:hypothetical protein